MAVNVNHRLLRYAIGAATAAAMAALGLRTHVGAIRQAGLKPLLLAATLFGFLMVGGYGVNRAVSHWLG